MDLWALGDGQQQMRNIHELQELLEIEVEALARRRNTRRLKESRRWAKDAPARIAHKTTKAADVVTSFSASARKDHRGERNPQCAADAGATEWAQPWKEAADGHRGEEIMKAIEAVTHVRSRHEDIMRPEFDEERRFRAASKLADRTGVGCCGLRPRHVALLTRGARAALGYFLSLVELLMRWPDELRHVIAVAIGKKA